MGRKNAARKNKSAGKSSTTSSSAHSSARSSARSSVGTAPTTPIGNITPTKPSSTSNQHVKRIGASQNLDCPPSNKRKASTKPWWIRCHRWMPQPCNWWLCRTFRNSAHALTIFLKGFTSPVHCLDRCLVVILLAATFFGCWVAIEGLLSIVKLVNAQDANCSIVYVTILGPIITVSLIGATASDLARGTYYYSVVDGTTQWLNSNAPPSQSPVRSTSMSTGVLYSSSWSLSSTPNPPISITSTPGLPVASSILPSTTPVQSTIVVSTGVLHMSSWSLSSVLNPPASIPSTLSLSTAITTITSTFSQRLTFTSTRSSTVTYPGASTFSESRFTLSLPKPSLSSLVGSSSGILDLSTSSKGSSNVPQNTAPSTTSVARSSFLSTIPGSHTISSSILLTDSSILVSVVTSSAFLGTSRIPPISSSALATVTLTSTPISSSSLSSQLTITPTNIGIPPALTSSKWLKTTFMASTTFVEPSAILTTPLSSISEPSSSWNNFTSSTLNWSTLTRGPTLSPSLTLNSGLSSSISSSQMPLFSMTTSRNWNSTSTGEVTTQVLSFGNTAYSFVFPVPDITTTVSYWTGSYPTASGTETGIPPSGSTRTIRQTPLSALPSFELFKPQPTGFKTMILGSATRTIVAAAAETTGCGEYGNFTLEFDDTSVGQAKSNILPVNGLTNPYHHLFYANGYTYVPDKWEPYPAISQPNVAMFLPLGGLLPNTPFAGTLLPGEIGAGPRASVSAYWFNAFHAYFGCALNGITACTLRISGYRYDATLKQEVLAIEQNVTIPACYGYIKCRLTQVFFNDQFKALSGIQFNAYTYNLGIPQIFMMDSLQMEWYNSSCAAGILRIGHR